MNLSVTFFFGKQRSALVASFELNLSLAICEAPTYFNIIIDGLHHILFPANVLQLFCEYCENFSIKHRQWLLLNNS